jgi:hypothetical protein
MNLELRTQIVVEEILYTIEGGPGESHDCLNQDVRSLSGDRCLLCLHIWLEGIRTFLKASVGQPVHG